MVYVQRWQGPWEGPSASFYNSDQVHRALQQPKKQHV